MSSEPPSRYSWEELLNDKDVVVLTKVAFFTTVKLLFHYAEDPERRTWEFFHYRGWEYILGTWCATFAIEGFAVSCGAQHPFIHRLLRGMHYALPDYVLLSHNRNANGEQEDGLLLVVEIKALGRVDPDTQAGRETAENIFQKTWQQRENQARLAFRNHPSQETVQLVMASGPWFAPYMFQRSELLPDSTLDSNDVASPPDYSPPSKLRRSRRGAVPGAAFRKAAPEGGAQGSVADAEDTGLAGNRGEEHSTVSQDSGKRKRHTSTAAREPVVNHVFQLGPSGERNALNPWFLRLLGKVKDNLEDTRGGFKTQNSWFDCSTNDKPVRDGHAEGFVLPTTTGSEHDVEDMGIDHVLRLDEDPALLNVPSTPGTTSETLNMMQLNAMLSPSIRGASRTLRGGSDTPFIDSYSRHDFGPVPLQPQETESVGLSAGDDITPKGQRGRPSQGSFSQPTARELSPSESRLERRQHGPLHSPQLYPVLPDSSPLRFTPRKQLFGDRMTVEGDSEFLADYDSPDPGSEAIARPASTSPAPSSSSSDILLHDTMHEDAPSGSSQPPLDDRFQQDYTDIIPGTSMAPPSHPIPPSRKVKYVLAPDYRTVPPSRQNTQRMDDPTASTGFRLTATPEEWHRNGPADSELWVIAMRASKQGVKDCEQAFRNAGMPEKLAHIATRRHYDVNLKRIRGSSSSSSRGNYNTTALAAPPLHPQRHRTRDSRDANPHPSQLHHSSVVTVPQPPTSGGDGASRSRPPRASGSGARTSGRTASRNDSHSESSSSDFPDGAPGPAALGLPNDAQMNRLAEGIGNLDVANVPGRAGNPGRGGDLSQDGLHGSDRLPIERRMQMFRERGMDDRQAEEAHGRYVKLWKTNLDDPAQFHPFLRFDAAASRRTAATSAAPVQRHRSALAGSDAHPLPQPSDEETPGETDVSLALLGSSVEQGQSRTNTSRKGKEKQR